MGDSGVTTLNVAFFQSDKSLDVAELVFDVCREAECNLTWFIGVPFTDARDTSLDQDYREAIVQSRLIFIRSVSSDATSSWIKRLIRWTHGKTVIGYVDDETSLITEVASIVGQDPVIVTSPSEMARDMKMRLSVYRKF